MDLPNPPIAGPPLALPNPRAGAARRRMAWAVKQLAQLARRSDATIYRRVSDARQGITAALEELGIPDATLASPAGRACVNDMLARLMILARDDYLRAFARQVRGRGRK